MSNSMKCTVCDSEHLGYGIKCTKCGARLKKKKTRSSPTKEKRKKVKKDKCSGNKKTYKSRSEASKARKGLQKEKGMMLRIYRCGTCSGFHLTKFRG